MESTATRRSSFTVRPKPKLVFLLLLLVFALVQFLPQESASAGGKRQRQSSVQAAALSLSAESGAPGSGITIRGSYFPPKKTGELVWDGTGTVGRSFKTNRRGQFSLTMNVPQASPGVYTIRATAGGVTATAPFTILGTVPTSTPTPIPATPTPTPSPSPTSTPTYSVLLSNIVVGINEVSADITLSTNQSGTVLVDLLAYQNGAKVQEAYQRGVVNDQTVRLTIADLTAGTYDLNVGVFTDDADWNPMLAWFAGVGSATIEASAEPTPTATASPTPTALSTACLGAPAYPELDPANATDNGTAPTLVSWQWDESQMGNKLRPYYDQISGACQGTTEQILEWVVRKWGFDSLGYPDLARAVAWKESTWRNDHKGDYETIDRYYYVPAPSPGYPSPDYQSYGITQVKRSVWPGSYPNSANSTAFAADYWAAVVRMAYDGQSWRGSGYGGDIWRAVQFWFDSGNDSSMAYANAVKEIYSSKPWQ